MIEKKVPVTTHLYQSQVDKIDTISRELKVTKAVLFREAIMMLIEKYENKQLDLGIK